MEVSFELFRSFVSWFLYESRFVTEEVFKDYYNEYIGFRKGIGDRDPHVGLWAEHRFKSNWNVECYLQGREYLCMPFEGYRELVSKVELVRKHSQGSMDGCFVDYEKFGFSEELVAYIDLYVHAKGPGWDKTKIMYLVDTDREGEDIESFISLVREDKMEAVEENKS